MTIIKYSNFSIKMLKEQINKIRNRHERILQEGRDNIAWILVAHAIEGVVWPIYDSIDKIKSNLNDTIVKRIMRVLNEKH